MLGNIKKKTSVVLHRNRRSAIFNYNIFICSMILFVSQLFIYSHLRTVGGDVIFNCQHFDDSCNGSSSQLDISNLIYTKWQSCSNYSLTTPIRLYYLIIHSSHDCLLFIILLHLHSEVSLFHFCFSAKMKVFHKN
jgi:hypothetical protein